MVAGVTVLAVLGGCKDSTSPNPGNNDTQSITVSVSTQSLSIAQGGSGSVGITVSRVGGFEGSITLAVEGLPTGVTGSPNPTPVPAGQTAATLTLNVAATAAANTSTITVRGSGSGVTAQTATFSLTVTAGVQGAFSLALNPVSVSLQQGSNSAVTVSITRTGSFTGTVALSASGAPSGLTTAFSPAAVSGSSSALTVTAGAATTPGTYSLIIAGTANGVSDQTTTLPVTVTAAPPSGNVTWTFCAASGVPSILAYQNGSGAWTRATPTGNTYSFNLPAGKGGIALITATGADVDIRIHYGSTQELAAQGAAQCQGSGLLENYTGTVAGAAATDQVWVTMAGATTVVLPAVNPSFALNNVPDRQADLLAGLITQTLAGGVPTYSLNRLILRRNLNPTAGAVLPVLDFGTSEAFAPITRNLSLTNLGTDVAMALMAYYTASGSSAAFFTDITPSGATARQFPGVPTGQQVTGDLHLLSILATPPGQQTPTETRSATIMFSEAVDKAIPLGPSLGAITVAPAASSPYVMPNLMTAIQPEYNKYFVASYNQNAGGVDRTVTIAVSAAYLGTTAATFDVSMPDLSPLPGWVGSWGFLTRNPITWWFSATGWDTTGGITGSPFAEGASSRTATRRGELRT
jgi:hypothetical protein